MHSRNPGRYSCQSEPSPERRSSAQCELVNRPEPAAPEARIQLLQEECNRNLIPIPWTWLPPKVFPACRSCLLEHGLAAVIVKLNPAPAGSQKDSMKADYGSRL